MERFYQYLNLAPMPLWLGMIFAPRRALTQRLARSSSVLGLAAVNYLVVLILALRNQDQVGTSADFTTLKGLSKLLGTQPGTLASWAHMLALDLFTGTWIFRQSDQLGAPGWVRAGSLFFTLVSGPLGLLFFLLWRVLGGKQPEALTESDA